MSVCLTVATGRSRMGSSHCSSPEEERSTGGGLSPPRAKDAGRLGGVPGRGKTGTAWLAWPMGSGSTGGVASVGSGSTGPVCGCTSSCSSAMAGMVAAARAAWVGVRMRVAMVARPSGTWGEGRGSGNMEAAKGGRPPMTRLAVRCCVVVVCAEDAISIPPTQSTVLNWEVSLLWEDRHHSHSMYLEL